MTDMYWVKTDPNTEHLCVGIFEIVVGHMSKAKKHWEGTLYLPVKLPRQYADVETMRALMSQTVHRWFAETATKRPACDNDETE